MEMSESDKSSKVLVATSKMAEGVDGGRRRPQAARRRLTAEEQEQRGPMSRAGSQADAEDQAEPKETIEGYYVSVV